MVIFSPRLECSYSVHGSVQAISSTVGNTHSDLALVYHLSIHHTHCSKMGMEICFVLADSRSTKGKGDRKSFEVYGKRKSLRYSSVQAPFPVNV